MIKSNIFYIDFIISSIGVFVMKLVITVQIIFMYISFKISLLFHTIKNR